MKTLRSLPIIDTNLPMIGTTMHDTIEIIYSKMAQSVKNTFLPKLPNKIQGISVHFLRHDLKHKFKLVKFLVNDLIVICKIVKEQDESKTRYFIKCIGIDNTIDINDNSFAFQITSDSAIIESLGIEKSTLPGLEKGSTVTQTSNALMKYFQPEAFHRIDLARIDCKNGKRFSLSWFRLLTKPTDTDDLSWYNSFGLKRVSPYVSNKKQIADSIDRIKNITAKELNEYYEKILDVLDRKILNGYFIYQHYPSHYVENSMIYTDKMLRYNNSENYKESLQIVKKKSPTTPLSEIMVEATCEERSVLFNTFPIIQGSFAGFYDTESKKETMFPHAKDIITMNKYMIGNTRKYSFTRKKKRSE
jgi:hypothetical protein